MSKYVPIFLLVVVVAVGVSAIGAYRPADGLSGKKTDFIEAFADEQYRAGDYAQSVAAYRELQQRDPKNPNYYLSAGNVYRYWGKFAESEAMFMKAAALMPNNYWVWTEIGKLYRNWGKYDRAEFAFKKSIELNPHIATTYSYGLGYLYLEQKRFTEAERAFKKAYAIAPSDEISIYGLGDLYREMAQYALSEKYFKDAIKKYPKSEARLGLAWLYIKQNRFKEAIPPLEEFLSLVREKGEVRYALGVAYKGLGDMQRAREEYEKAVALNPDNETFRSALDALNLQK